MCVWNDLAAALMGDFAAIAEKERNYLRLAFTHPAMKSLYADWDSVAQTAVAQVRMDAAKYPDDPKLARLVGELSVRDNQFRKWWADQLVATRGTGTKTLNHPIAGELTLDWDTLTASTDPDQQLLIWTAEPGTPSHDGLRMLASWAATQKTSTNPPHAQRRDIRVSPTSTTIPITLWRATQLDRLGRPSNRRQLRTLCHPRTLMCQ
jgi:hypothetical protein